MFLDSIEITVYTVLVVLVTVQPNVIVVGHRSPSLNTYPCNFDEEEKRLPTHTYNLLVKNRNSMAITETPPIHPIHSFMPYHMLACMKHETL